MSRVFSVPLEITSAPLVVTTDPEQDIWELTAGSVLSAHLHGFQLTSEAIAAEDIELQLCRRTTAGNGTSLTQVKHDVQDGTASVAVEALGLTPGTEGDVLATFNWEQLGPLNWLYIPEDRIVVKPGAIISLTLMSALAGSTNMSGWVTWEEM